MLRSTISMRARLATAIGEVVSGILRNARSARTMRKPPSMDRLETRILFGFYSKDPTDEQPPPLAPDPAVPLGPPAPDPTVPLPGGQSPAACSCAPVREFDGLPVVTSQDISTDGFGIPWGYTRSWTGLNNSSLNGNGWSITQLPYLVVAGGTNGASSPGTSTSGVTSNTTPDDRISVVEGGTSVFTFTNPSSGSTYSAWGANNATLQNVAGGMQLTDAQGNITQFYDVYRSSGRATPHTMYDLTDKYGYFKGWTSADGTTTITTSYDSAGYLQTVTRSDSVTGDTQRMQFTYTDVSNSQIASHSAASATLVGTVTLQEAILGGWKSLQRSIYSYYTGETAPGTPDANGRLGDLKIAETQLFGPVSVSISIATGGSLPLSSQYYQVTAILPDGETSPSEEVSIIPSGGNQTAAISWSAVSNATSYRIYRGSEPGREAYLAQTSSTSYSDTNATTTTAQPPVTDTRYYRYYKFTGESWYTSAYPYTYDTTTVSKGPQNTSYTTLGPNPFAPIIPNGSLTSYDPTNPQAGDSLVFSGLKTVVEGPSYARMAAANSSYQSASDSTLKPFVDHFFVYERWDDHVGVGGNVGAGSGASDSNESHIWRTTYRLGTRYRVVEEVASSDGSQPGDYKYEYTQNNYGVTSGTNYNDGLGYNTIDYNTWRMKTTVYQPSSASDWALHDRVVTYTNEIGQPLLEVNVGVDTTSYGISGMTPSFVSSNGVADANETVTVTSTGHPFNTGDTVAISGILPEVYDGVFTVTRVDADHFTFVLPQNYFWGAGNYSHPYSGSFSSGGIVKVLNQSENAYRYDSNGELIQEADPSAVLGYDETQNDPTDRYIGSSLVTDGWLSVASGTIHKYVYGTSYYMTEEDVQHGTGSNAIELESYTYTNHSFSGGPTTYRIATDTKYRNIDGTGGQTTSYSYQWFAGTDQVEAMTTSATVISAGQNGPGTADVTTRYFNRYGQVIDSVDGDGYVTQTNYDSKTGAVVGTVQDATTGYLPAVLQDQPLGYWRLGEGAGAVASDGSGNLLDGLYYGSPTLGAGGALSGDPDHSLTLNGSTQFVNVGDRAPLTLGSALTIEAWINPASPASGYQDVISKADNASATNYQLRIGYSGSAQMQFVVTIGGTAYVAQGSTVLSSNKWYHVAATYDGSTMKVYVDGNLDGSQSVSGTLDSTTEPVLIGARAFNTGGQDFFSGKIDEAAVYGSALTASRISAHYVAGRSYAQVVQDTSPAGYWRLGEVSGTTAIDSSGHSLNGTYTPTLALGVGGAITGDPDTAADFNGISSYVDLGNPTALNFTGQITLSAWVKPASSSGLQDIVAHGYASSEVYLRINSGSYEVGSWDGWNVYQTSATISSGDIGKWVHLVGVYDGANWKLYRNGTLASSTAASSGSLTVSSDWGIGAGGNSSDWRFFSGSIDEVSIHNYGLTAAQVDTLFSAGHYSSAVLTYAAAVAAAQPYAYWRLSEASGTTAADTSGNARTGTYSGTYSLGQPSALTTDSDHSVSFSGGYVGSNFVFNSATASVEVWVKLNALPSSNTLLAGCANGVGSTVFDKDLYVDSSGNVHWYIWDGAAKTVNGPALVVGQWYHVVGTADGTTSRLFVNGAQAGSSAAGNSYSSYTANNFFISGGSSAFGSGINAVVDEAALYNTAISPDSIIAHYFAGRGGSTHLALTSTYEVDGQGRVTKQTTPNGNITYTVYNDTLHETKTYPGWNSTTHTTTGPIQISREYWPAAGSGNLYYQETLTSNATPGLDGSSLPDGSEGYSSSNILSLSRQIANDSGLVSWSDRYATLANPATLGTLLTYSQTISLSSGSATEIGTSGTNYYRTSDTYDARGRVIREVDPNGTITRTVYDYLGRTLSKWVGTNDATTGDWSPANNNTGTCNMVKVEDDAFDQVHDFVSSPAAPTLSSTSGGVLAATTYYVKVTYVGPSGETLASSESSQSVSANNLLVVSSPSSATGASAYNVYVSTSSGTEVLQTPTPISLGTNWTEPVAGVYSNFAAPGTAPTLSVVLGTSFPGTYWVRITYVTAGGETEASPESTATTISGYHLGVTAPNFYTAGIVGYNVYVGSSSGTEILQNTSGPVAIGQSWSQSSALATSIAVPSAPGLSQTSGGSTPAGTYYVSVSYVGSNESLMSGETSISLSANNRIVVTSPASSTGATGYNVYIRSASGAKILQNSVPISLGTNWTMPTTGFGAPRGMMIPVDVGDGNLTQRTVYSAVGTGRVVQYEYDWQNRQVVEKDGVQSSESTDVHRPILYTQYDNLGEPIEEDQYDGDGIALSTLGYSDGVPVAPSSSLLRAKSTSSYDDQGRVYESNSYSVNQSSGSVGSALTTDMFFDHRGNAIATFSPDGQVTKAVYDGAGRVTTQYVTDGGALNNSNTQQKDWGHAGSVSNDVILTQTENTYDADGNSIVTTTRDRYNNAEQTGVGSTGPLADPSASLNAAAAYAFAEGSGTTAGDSSGNGRTATLYGGVTWTTAGHSGNALVFDGSSGYADLGVYNPSGSFTVSTWVKFSGTYGGQIFNSRDGITDNGFNVSASGATGMVEFYTHGSSGGTDLVVPAPSAFDGNWHQLAATFDATTGAGVLYVDGNQVGSKTMIAPGTTTSHLLLGRFTYVPVYYLSGSLSEVRVYSSALTSQQLANQRPPARVSYSAAYYDAADRMTDQVDVGTNGGSAYARPSSVPTVSDTVLVTHTDYDDSGNPTTITDPRNQKTHTMFDMLGRQITVIGGWTSGTSGAQSTLYTYDGNNNILTMTAVQPGGTNQITAYVYGVGTTTGTDLFSNNLLAKVEYPDKSTGAASTSSSDDQSFTYDLLGETLTKTDQNGNVHSYTYDILGRNVLDVVTTLGSGVDGGVRAVGTSYNALGLPYQQTSYSNSAATTIANQVQDVYNGFGQLTTEYQAHGGAVNTSSSPSVVYTYDTAADTSRLSSMTYPNGRVLHFGYDNSPLDNDISRVDYLADDNPMDNQSVGDHLQDYSYVGLGTIVQRAEGNGVSLSYVQQPGDTLTSSDGGDQYTGLDRFGRVIDQNWVNTSTGTSTDRFQYGYDRNSNVLYKKNLLASTFSELYHANSSASGDNNSAYDSINRLTSFRRGTLSASGHNGTVLDTVSTLNTLSTSQQGFTLDALGNQTSVTTDGSATSRTANSQNQLTVVGSTSLAYDNNGNTTTDDQSHTLVYDAWNRLVAVKNGGTTLTSYSFDAAGNRITEGAGTPTDLYFSSAGQVLEERQTSTVTNQYVWGLGYVNDLVLRDHLTTAGGLDNSFNSTGKVTTSVGTGAVAYSDVIQPDGKILVAGASGSGGIVTRYNSDGSLDSGFGSSGIATYSGVSFYDLCLLNNGKIVAAGLSGSNFCVVRFNADGSVDSSFGSSGITTVDFGATDYANGIAIQADQKIVLVGAIGSGGGSGTEDWALARLTSSGSLDTTFGTSGKVTLNWGGDDAANGVVIQNTGKIVVAGLANGAGGVARFNTDGSLDTSFGSGGTGKIALTTDYDYRIAMQSLTDQRLLVTGVESGQVVLHRFSADGIADSTFGTSGTVTTSLGATDWGYDVAVQGDGKVVVTGGSFASGGAAGLLIRYNIDGSLDTTFGTSGKLLTYYGTSTYSEMDYFKGVAIQKDGQIVAVGAANGNFALSRYNGGVSRLYYQQDANYNVTALTDVNGAVTQRYVYSPYGKATVLTSSWASSSESYSNVYTFQGGRYDSVSTMLHFGAREYSSSLGRWIEAEPAGASYVDGINLYQFNGGAPLDNLDPSGEKTIVAAFEGFGGYKHGKYGNIISVSGAWLEHYWEGPVKEYGNDPDWRYYPENAVGAAVGDLLPLLKSKSKEKPCSYNTVVVLGFSNGGHAAWQFAKRLESSHISVNAVLTADPVAKAFQVLWNPHKPTNVHVWENYYQQHDGHFRTISLGLIALRGRPIIGADVNKELFRSDFSTQIDFDFAHYWGEICNTSVVLGALRRLMGATPSFRTSNSD